MQIAPQQSLVKYDNPVLVNDLKKKNPLRSRSPLKTTKGGKKLPPVDPKPNISQTEDILNSILPPREYEENGQLWVQYVSSTPATRLDVINLQQKLDQQLAARKAKMTGICPVREELYRQCFDELIRQVTVRCVERGLLLLRVRDEIRMTIDAYRTLHESSVAFGMRKALQAEQGKNEMKQRIEELEKENSELKNQLKEAEARFEALKKRETEKRKQDEKKYEEEIAFLKKQNQQYKNELDRIMQAPQNLK